MQTYPEQEHSELAGFREAWKAEVRQKNATVRVTSGVHPPSSAFKFASNHESISRPGPSSETVAGSPPQTSLEGEGLATLRSAVAVYRQAVQCEQAGRLDDALRLYRQAFRVDPHVDKAYYNEEKRLEVIAAGSPGVPVIPRAKPSIVDDMPRRTSTAMSLIARPVTETLASLLDTFPPELVFEPEDEREPSLLSTLPDELLVLILRKLDHSTIERFAAVNRKGRVISLDSVIWQELVEMTYKPPQIPYEDTLANIVDRYSYDYRRLYVEHPRLRMDGVYIAVCHYVRQGLSENTWVNISHLITYHRYLRFLPNGNVLSLLSNEERPPQEVVPLLKPDFHMKGLFVGTWHLNDTSVHITNLLDATYLSTPSSPSRSSCPPLSAVPLFRSHTSSSPRYTFDMLLHLRSRPLGRWNKLELVSYESRAVESGEVCPLGLKHERPFWFSRVKSWID